MNSSITIAQFKDDILKIITGQISAVADLSDGCDKSNSQVVGAYPANVYSAVDAASFTFSKVHNEYTDVTHYFRLGFDSTVMNAWTLAQGYNSGSNVLLNSQSLTDEFSVHRITRAIDNGELNISSNNNFDDFWGINTPRSSGIAVGDRIETISPRTDIAFILPGTRIEQQNTGNQGQAGIYKVSKLQTVPSQSIAFSRETSVLSLATTAFDAVTQPTGIDFVITNKLFFISSPASGINLGIFDLGKNGLSREYDTSMLMASIDLNNSLVKIPYHYKFSTFSFGTLTDILITGQRPIKQFEFDNSLVVIENPAFAEQIQNGNAVSVIYGLFLIPTNTIGNNTVYQDSANLRRLVINNYAILTE
jgi:hypothetical protein